MGAMWKKPCLEKREGVEGRVEGGDGYMKSERKPKKKKGKDL